MNTYFFSRSNHLVFCDLGIVFEVGFEERNGRLINQDRDVTGLTIDSDNGFDHIGMVCGSVNNPAIVFTMITSVVILAPVAEELFFRGLLYNLMAPRGNMRAMVFISVVFGLIHYSGTGGSGADILSGLVRTIPFMALSGFLFTSYRLTGNILSPIVCHMLFNLFGVIATRNGG